MKYNKKQGMEEWSVISSVSEILPSFHFFMDFYFGSITLIILSLTIDLISAIGIVYSSDEQRTIKQRHRGLAGDWRDGC